MDVCDRFADFDHSPRYFMTGHKWIGQIRKPGLDFCHVQIRSANSAGADLDQDIQVAYGGIGDLDHAKF